MNKYSKLSDFEVNKLIADRIVDKVNFNILNEMYLDGAVEIVRKKDNLKIYADWIKAYDESFKLMIYSNISLTPSIETSTWIASGVINYRMSIFPVEHGNPCRAIAECFLLMKDEEIANETKTN